MAVIALKCPSCNGELRMDESLETGFCTYCGTKIMVQEEVQKIKVIHSGKVELDESNRVKNYMNLANTAFSNKNYDEAYQYYTKVLECDSASRTAVFGRGLCAGYLSSPVNLRIVELVNAYNRAVGMLPDSEAQRGKDEMLRSIYAFIVEFFEKYCDVKRDFVFSDINNAKAHYACMDTLVSLCIYSIQVTGNDTADAVPGCEEQIKQVVKTGLEICKKALDRVTYFYGMKTVRAKDGTVTSQRINEKLAPTGAENIKAMMKQLKSLYNGLPGTQRAIGEFNAELAKHQAVVDDYENSLKGFFIQNPQDEKTYRHPGLFGAKKKREAVEQKFSPELIGKRDRAHRSEDEIDDLKRKKKKYLSDNTLS